MHINTKMINRKISTLIQITWNVKSLFKQSHYVTVQRLVHTTQHELQNDESRRRRRFPPVSSLPASPYNSEDSINDWSRCTNHYDVFSKIKQRHENMTVEDAVAALNVLFNIDKDSRIEQNITQLNEFDILCRILKKDMRSLSLHHLINILKVLNHFQIHSTTVIVQMILQLIRSSVNYLSMDQGIFLIHLLPKLQKTPLVEALMIALPLVLQATAKTQLDTENIPSLISSLEYFSAQNGVVDEDIVLRIINSLNNLKNHSINTGNAIKLLFVLLRVKENLINMELLSKVYDILTEDINAIRNTAVLPTLIHKISEKTKKSRNIFYDAKFLDACVTRIISEKPKIEETISIIRNFNQIFHSSSDMVNYILDRSIEIQYFSRNPRTSERINLINAISIIDQKPNSWDILQESILDESLLDLNFNDILKLSIKLLAFGCYWPKLIEKVFDSCNKEKRISMIMKRRLVILHHIVKNFYPQFYGPFIPDEDIELFQSSFEIKNLNTLLKKALESILGGPQYILCNIRTEYGEFIDFIAIMRKGGYPVTLHNMEKLNLLSLKDIEVPKDSQIFFILSMPANSYSFNTHCLAPSLRLLKKLYEINPNHTVITVFNDEWSKLSEFSRLKYLSDIIKLKTNQESMDISC